MAFNNWPWTSLQNLNLDWILRVCKEAQEAADSVDEYDARITAISAVANEAVATADSAYADVQLASRDASNALATANSANSTANSASSTATNALSVASAAETQANNAETLAETAEENAGIAVNLAEQAMATVSSRNTKVFMTGLGTSFADTQGNTLTRAQILSKLTAGDNLYFVKTDTKEIFNLFAADTNYFSIYEIQHDANNATNLRIITVPESGTVNVYSYPFPSGGSGGGDGIYLINAEYVAQNSGFTLDKTSAQIFTAINSGLLPVVRNLDDELADNVIAKLFVLGNYSYDGEDSYFSFYRATGTQIEELRKAGSESYAYIHTFNYLPASTSADSGKFLRVNAQGMPAWVTVPAAENASFGGA